MVERPSTESRTASPMTAADDGHDERERGIVSHLGFSSIATTAASAGTKGWNASSGDSSIGTALPGPSSPVSLTNVGPMSTPKPPTILVIMGRVRAGRRCPQIAEWVLSLADKSDHLAYEIVDLQEWHLPFDDEPSIPAKGAYTHDHTRAWSTKVASADGTT